MIGRIDSSDPAAAHAVRHARDAPCTGKASVSESIVHEKDANEDVVIEFLPFYILIS